ncbi:hypothetical protein Dip510_000286 [Elusimicrobium posterum]|uniref:SIMPL domain-containing protein n=1 Tax=Elusimicrobium posterum TaxID=3116653 RepID=UPI003C7482C5
MKKLAIVFLALTLLAGIGFAKEKERFSVNADAEVRIKPDRVTITFGVNESEEVLKTGKDRMKKVVGEALAFCKKNGVKDKYIQTENIYISPRTKRKYEHNNRKYPDGVDVIYYDFNQTFTVTLEDLTKYDTILYGLLDLGINKVENVNFYSTQMRKYRDEARLAAIKHAQEKAALLTGAVGIKLGKVVNISEDSYQSYWGGYRNAMSNVSQNMVQNYGGGDEEATDLAAGMISVKAKVTLYYDLD